MPGHKLGGDACRAVLQNQVLQAAHLPFLPLLPLLPGLQASSGTLEWQLPDSYQLRYHELADELAVGGVYVRLYLKDPRYPLRYG